MMINIIIIEQQLMHFYALIPRTLLFPVRQLSKTLSFSTIHHTIKSLAVGCLVAVKITRSLVFIHSLSLHQLTPSSLTDNNRTLLQRYIKRSHLPLHAAIEIIRPSAAQHIFQYY